VLTKLVETAFKWIRVSNTVELSLVHTGVEVDKKSRRRLFVSVDETLMCTLVV